MDEHTPAEPQQTGSGHHTELEELKKKVNEYLHGWKRARADYDNFRKQTEKRIKELQLYERESSIVALLPILDAFEEAFKHVPENAKHEPWVQGVQNIYKQMLKFLESNDVKSIEDSMFNPELHEAIDSQWDPKKKDLEIIDITRRGYTLGGKVIRPAIVTINSNNEQKNDTH